MTIQALTLSCVLLGRKRSLDKSIHTAEYATLLTLLRETRQAAGVTQVALAKQLSETQSQISKLERGEVCLDVIELRTILVALGATLPAFVTSLEERLRDRQESAEEPG